MARTRMHADEIFTDSELVGRLLAGQFPEWAGLAVRPVLSHGTDHDIYRLGQHLVVRLPRIAWAARQPVKEARWLPHLAPHLPLALPVPVALGRPCEGYPFGWAIHEWLPGEHAGFVRALRSVDRTGAAARSPGGRGGPLAPRDETVARCIAGLGDRIDGAAALRSWRRSLEAPAWNGDEVWVDADLLPGNLLVLDGRLSAVIDFGALAVGDPACDLLPAWLFSGRSRQAFLDALDTDEAARLRGRGWVLSQAVIALPYYWDTNPGILGRARHALAEVLAEDGVGS